MDDSAQAAISDVLRRALAEGQVRNPSYSLRAFARRLEISPSALSEILGGKRRVSRKTAAKLVDKLCLGPRQQQQILSLFRAPGATAKDVPAEAPAFEVLDPDKFAAIADWYHFAILSLMETKSFRDDPAWIAKRLGIASRDATAALERLERLGLVARTPRGKLVPTQAQLSTTDGIRSLSLRKAHAANLALAQTSLDRDPLELRDFCATTMAIDPERLPEARQMVREFIGRLSAFLEGSGRQTEVYKFCAQLFPVSR